VTKHGTHAATEPIWDLLTIGETMVLITPREGGAVALDADAVLSAGGAESNVAVAAASLGLRSAWLSRIGMGPLGQLVLSSVARRGVDISSVRVDPTRPTGLMIKAPGVDGSEVYYYRTDSAAAALSRNDLEGIPLPAVVHVSGILAAVSPSGLDLVRGILGGVLGPAVVSFDVNYRPALWSSISEAAVILRELAAAADIVFVGRDEAEQLWGTSRPEDVRALFSDVPTLVVKDADVEAVEFGPEGTARVSTPPVVVVEPVGAGDAFAAGWLAARHRGESAVQRLSAGHATAAAVLQSYSDQFSHVPST
jgi:2-dehydro-3-deoxygluconokinase